MRYGERPAEARATPQGRQSYAAAAAAMEGKRKAVWSHRRTTASSNERMHERNHYRRRAPHFATLAERHPALRKHLVGTGARPVLNWKDPEAGVELTKVGEISSGGEGVRERWVGLARAERRRCAARCRRC